MQLELYITTPLDEQQELILQREESALRYAQTQRVIQNRIGYVSSTPDVEQRLRQMEGRSLSIWAIDPAVTSPEDIVFRQVLH